MSKIFKPISSFSVVLLLLFFNTSYYAQSTGLISGRVVDSETGEYLPGASVILQGTNIGTATDLQGLFRIANIPIGKHTVQIKYMGYESFSTEAVVKAESITNLNVKLKVSYVKMNDVVVSGLRQGATKALSVQRESDNIKNVLSKEQIENYPDQNAAEVLQRVPGVYISRSGGDGRFVLIRGTDPRLSSVTVNGDPLATNRNQQRYSQMDIIGSSQIAYLEVNKTMTPDMDANSIGGSVNIISRSAFDYPGTSLKVGANSGYANLDRTPLWGGSVNYSTRLGEDNNIGIALNVNWDQKNRGVNQIESAWGPKTDVNKNIIPYALTEVNLEDVQLLRNRYGIGGSIEYRFDNYNKIYAKLLWSEFDDGYNRSRTRLRVDRGTYLNQDGTLIQNAQIVRESKSHIEKQLQNNLSLGGENHFGDLALDYNLAYSIGRTNTFPDVVSTWTHSSKFNLALDLSNTLYPKWNVTNLDQSVQNDPTKYGSPSFDYRDFNASNSYTVGGLNASLPYDFFGFFATVKAGMKYTHSYKDNGDTHFSYSWKGTTPLTMANFLSSRNPNDFLAGNYVFGPEADYPAVKDFVNQNLYNSAIFPATENVWDALGQTYQVRENVMAYYLMTDVKFGDLSVLAGFRHEFISDSQDGYKLVFDSKGNFSSISPISSTLNYSDLFPMIHFNYNISEMTKARFAVTRTTSRPNYWDLVPYFYIQDKGLSIRAGNSNLKPTYSYNFDFSAEHYFSGIGIASVGLFYKSLKDISYQSTTLLQSGTYAGYSLQTTVNGGSSDLYGVELNWQQELTFLSDFFSGFGIYANYCHTWAKANLVGREGFLPGQAGDITNVALAYENGGFKARVSYQYQGKFITAVGINENFDYYVASHGGVDFTASQKLFKGFDLFMDVTNINNALDQVYMGDPSRPTNIQMFSWYSRAGIKYSLD
ncbi:MAG: TonB-dependent receptor [Ignavibacteriales bacterium]|nr:TonB-dependent receptor [Ignavibacteriales bacterium]